MIQLHCTKKLLVKLPLNSSGQLLSKQQPRPIQAANEDHHQPEISFLSGWHGNLLTLQRRQCVLLVHDTTRFPVFIPCLTKSDFAELDSYFADVLMNTLLKVGADDAMMQRASQALAPLVCDNHCDRSVQGTMNQMAQDLDYRLDYHDKSVNELMPYSTSAMLADRPCSVKGVKDGVWPIKAMLALVAAIPAKNNGFS